MNPAPTVTVSAAPVSVKVTVATPRRSESAERQGHVYVSTRGNCL